MRVSVGVHLTATLLALVAAEKASTQELCDMEADWVVDWVPFPGNDDGVVLHEFNTPGGLPVGQVQATVDAIVTTSGTARADLTFNCSFDLPLGFIHTIEFSSRLFGRLIVADPTIDTAQIRAESALGVLPPFRPLFPPSRGTKFAHIHGGAFFQCIGVDPVVPQCPPDPDLAFLNVDTGLVTVILTLPGGSYDVRGKSHRWP